jgi:two-component system cell cycle response regulator DivK
LKQVRILIVEDMPDSRDLLRTLLEFDGHTVIEATNGREGVEAVENYHPDLILMDLGMPVMDGYEATRRIRNSRIGATIPIVAISADYSSGSSQRALEAGCDRCEAKPYSAPQLRALLQRLNRAA